MKFGALLRASAVPDCVQRINIASTFAPQMGVTDWSSVPPLIDPLGNDAHGCCCYAAKWTWARIKHAARYGRVASVDASSVLQDYAHTGFDPVTGANDNGTDPNDMMLTWAKDADQLIFEQQNWPIVWATVDPRNENELAAAVSRTPLLMTIEMSEADLGDPDSWSGPPRTYSSPPAGHEVLLLRNGSMWKVSSWGRYYDWSPERMNQVYRLDAPLEASHTDFARLGLDYDAAMRGVT